MAEKAGIATALAEIGPIEVDDAPEVQLDLMPGPVRAAVPLPPCPGPNGRRSAGRPPGSRNRRTEEMLQWLFEVKGHMSPLQGLVEIYSRKATDLAFELGCDPLDALRLQADCMKALLPYTAQKLPQTIDVNKRSAGVIVIGDLTADNATDLDAIGVLIEAQGQQYQSLSDDDLVKSETQQSDGDE